MSAEKIINRIQKDAENERKQILKDAENQAKKIIDQGKKEAQSQADHIVRDGEQQCDNITKIMLSKTSQEVKREIMKAREKIIDECFTKAHHQLSILHGTEYTTIVTKLIENGKKKIPGGCSLLASREADKTLAKTMGITVTGTIETAGGVILKSSDGRITLDHTFDGILKRKKDEIRRKVGQLLFSS